jgi:hypothetical protein
MSEIVTQLLIDAPPSIVWERLVDKGRWKSFSDFVDLSPGRPIEAGCTFWFGLRLLGLPPVPIRVEVLRCDSARELRWVGGLPALPLFRGEHYFRFEDAAEGRTRFVHGELFDGLLQGPFMLLLGETTRKAYVRFNLGLAAQARVAAGRS